MRSFRRQAETESNGLCFDDAACISEKILLRLQVWNLAACGQIMRGADCKASIS